jgi:hypothetical protein
MFLRKKDQAAVEVRKRLSGKNKKKKKMIEVFLSRFYSYLIFKIFLLNFA